MSTTAPIALQLPRLRRRGVPGWAGRLLWVAAGIHIALIPEHFEERFVYGIFFLAAALFQVVLGWRLIARPHRRACLVGALGSVGLLAVWIVTRVIAPPLSLEGTPEPVTLAGVLAKGAELGALVLLAPWLPVPRAEGAWARRGWGAVAACGFAGLFLLASGAVSNVSFAGDPPSLHAYDPGLSLKYPLIYGLFLPHVWVVGSWSTFVLMGIGAVLVGANVASLLRRRPGKEAVSARRRGLIPLLPSLLAVSSCCGMPAALFLGTTSIGFLFGITPWLLMVTDGLLATNLLLLSSPRSRSRAITPAVC